MTVFVLVHGSWGGGWQWSAIARILRAQGHVVSTPTLTGLGERAHVSPEGVTLLTHVEDVVQHLWFEDLSDVVLVGWSYGGAVVDGVADRSTGRVSRVINVDGMLVEEGQPLDDSYRTADDAESWTPAPTSADLAPALTDEALRDFVARREQPNPVGTMTTPYPDLGGRRWLVPHTYLMFTELPPGEEWDAEDLATIERLDADERWEVRRMPLNHLGLLYAPDIVAEVLLDVAGPG